MHNLLYAWIFGQTKHKGKKDSHFLQEIYIFFKDFLTVQAWRSDHISGIFVDGSYV